jgi:hypothetical protein
MVALKTSSSLYSRSTFIRSCDSSNAERMSPGGRGASPPGQPGGWPSSLALDLAHFQWKVGEHRQGKGGGVGRAACLLTELFTQLVRVHVLHVVLGDVVPRHWRCSHFHAPLYISFVILHAKHTPWVEQGAV